MQESKNVNIGIIRSPNASYTRAYNRLLTEQSGATYLSDTQYDQNLSNRIDDLRAMFEEAADAVGVKFAVTEYQLHEDDHGLEIMNKKRKRLMEANDILATVDPTPSRYKFVTRSSPRHPLQRSVVAFTHQAEVMDVISLLRTNTVPLIQGALRGYVQRVFALHLPLNDEVAAGKYQGNVSVVTMAVRYPCIEPQKYFDSPYTLKVLDEEDPLSQKKNRHYLCEPEEEI